MLFVIMRPHLAWTSRFYAWNTGLCSELWTENRYK